MRTYAILTAGGDAPGMNAAIRSATRTVLAAGGRMLGSKRGFTGLINDDFIEMDRSTISNIIQRGGSILHSTRCEEFKTKEGRAAAIENCKKRGIEGIIMVGGDGTMKGALVMQEEGGPRSLGIPCTIDNDIAGLDMTIGFDTAVNTAIDAIDRIRDTAETMERLFFIETMGHASGAIALAAGVAGGANAVLIPEQKSDIEAIARKLREDRDAGAQSLLVVVAEGDDIGGTYTIAKKISVLADIESRVSVLGYMQRGGNPTARDRIIATVLGVQAATELMEGKGGYVVGWKCEGIVRIPFAEARTSGMALPPDIARNADLLLM